MVVVGGGGGVRTKFSVQLWSQTEQFLSTKIGEYLKILSNMGSFD